MIYSDYPFDDRTHLLVRLAEEIAKEYAHSECGGEHLFWAAVQEDIGLIPIYQKMEKDPSALRRWAEIHLEKLPKSTQYSVKPKMGEGGVAVFNEANKLCLRYGLENISPLEVLESICTPTVAFKAETLRRLPIALYEIVEMRSNLLSAPAQTNSTTKTKSDVNIGEAIDILDKYCNNLNLLAREGKIDPVIGRDRETKQLVELLGKRLSPNVVIVGEPGVGKTALVGGLVLKILNGNVPEKLQNATVYELDISGRLVAGTYKGEVEERLKAIIKAIKSHDNKAILFVDEIHILLDERGSVGSGVVNLLKPELARGEITVIGATTQTEYRKYIEKDTAFNRRFTQLVVQEPDEALAAQMLTGLLPIYEKHHGMGISPDTLPKAVQLAKKYITEKKLPVSAIELLDFTLACATQMKSTTANILEKIKQDWEANPTESARITKDMKNNLSELLLEKLEEHQDKDIPAMVDLVRAWMEQPKTAVDPTDVEAIIAYQTGIPIGRLRSKEQDKFSNIKEVLRQRVVGQDHVIDAVADALKTFRANLKEPNEPGAIFFFTGPTGTGKTELAKAIAELLFDDERTLMRFDMSEYQQPHAVEALTGAPPGFVGYEEGGLLVNQMRRNPYSVVLFDEIEKAHRDIYGLFLQILTDSRLQDKQGKMADFSNAIIVFTSNSGAEDIINKFQKGEVPDIEFLKKTLRKTGHFKDEFLGRIDTQILPFAPISEQVALQILDIHIKKYIRMVKRQQNINLSISDSVKQHLMQIGFSPLYGARPLRNAIKTFLTPQLASKILSENRVGETNLSVDLDNVGRLVWTDV